MRHPKGLSGLSVPGHGIAIKRCHIGIRRAGGVKQNGRHRAADRSPFHNADQKSKHRQKRII